MALEKRKDTGKWRFRLKQRGADGKTEDYRVTLEAGISERAARKIDEALTAALKFNEFRFLNEDSRRVCITLFRNQGRPLPPALLNCAGYEGSAGELTLMKAVEYCLNDPEVLDLADPSRADQAFTHVIAYFGPDFAVSQLKARQIKEYMLARKIKGAAAATVNRERSSLSKMFKVLLEAELVDRNPVKDTKPADERAGQRDVYLSFTDFNRIVAECSDWAKPIFRTLYFSGMRRGEVLGLTWANVNLEKRIITLDMAMTKERRPKRVPISRILIPEFEKANRVRRLFQDRVFLNAEGFPPHEDSLSRVWRTAVKAVGIGPGPTVHDLRHCWKTNAMRSRVYPAIADAIVGHGDRKKDVKSRYLSISDSDLLDAIDRMRFDFGETDIRVSERGCAK
jgi:integrase